jgi:hypothetical protein
MTINYEGISMDFRGIIHHHKGYSLRLN